MKFFHERRGALCAVFISLLVLSGYWYAIGKIQLCFFRLLTGLPCPGCGLTHAGFALLKGNWRESLFYHALFIPAFLLLSAVLSRHFRQTKTATRSKCLYLPFFFICMVYYLARMVLYFPGGEYPMTYDYASIAGMIIKAFCH